MKGRTRTVKKQPGAANSSIPEGALSPGANHRMETRLEIPAGEPDLSALRLVMKEWLVPRLVDEFLRERGIRLKRTQTALANQQNELAKPIYDGT